MSVNCFVMMPSGSHGEYEGKEEESNFIFNGIICPAVRSALGSETRIVREADERKSGAITTKIVKQIAEFDVSIVDITGQNPNVFLELGMRYALRRSTTIPLKQKGTPVPFDIASFRYIEYKAIFDGVERAREDIKLALQQATGDGFCDSLVFEVFPNLEVTIPVPSGQLPSTDRMPWSAYKQSLRQVIDTALDIFRDGRYVPAAVVGITNGGAMFADLLSRELFGGTIPMASLWANRNNHSGYFDNEINQATIKGVSEVAKKVKDPSVLLVDDIVASGTTHHQALQFLKSNLEDVDVRFLPLFSRNEKYFDPIKEHILWKHPVFNISDKDIINLHNTEWLRLPYDKDIRAS
jgi:hypoxanthine phosphoribosyltransferase